MSFRHPKVLTPSFISCSIEEMRMRGVPATKLWAWKGRRMVTVGSRSQRIHDRTTKTKKKLLKKK